MNQQPDNDKIYVYSKDLYEPKYQLLINKYQDVNLRHCKDPKVFIAYLRGIYMIWGYRNILGPKSHAIEIDNIYEDFELYQAFMHNFLCQNIRIFPLYILYTLCILVKLTNFVSKHFGLKSSYKKN